MTNLSFLIKFINSCYRWPCSPNGPAHGTTFWPGLSTARPGNSRVGPVPPPRPLHKQLIFMLHIFWCYFYDLRLRLWIWEVESCKKIIVALCWWSDHGHCMVILIFLQNQAVGRPGPSGYAGRHGMKSARGPVLGLKARHAGQVGTARYGPCPARSDGHL